MTFNSCKYTSLLSWTLLCVFILVAIRNICHTFTQCTNIAPVLTESIVQYIHCYCQHFCLKFPVFCLFVCFVVLLFPTKESCIFSAIQTVQTRELLFWGKSQDCLDRIMSQRVVKNSGLGKSPTLGWLLNTREIPQNQNTLLATSNLWIKDCNMKRNQESWHMKKQEAYEGARGIFQTQEIYAPITQTTSFHLTVFLILGIVFHPQNVLFSIWKRWQKWNHFPSFLTKPPSDWSWPPVPIPLD